MRASPRPAKGRAAHLAGGRTAESAHRTPAPQDQGSQGRRTQDHLHHALLPGQGRSPKKVRLVHHRGGIAEDSLAWELH